MVCFGNLKFLFLARIAAFLGCILNQLVKSVTGIIGLKEAVLTQNRILRFIWASLLILGTFATGFFIYKTACNYFDEPTYTTVSSSIRS